MEDIKVGEFIRTKDGIIGKVFEEDDIGIIGVCIDNSFFDDYGEITNFVCFEDITKHSTNIIDLIEVGDYINGMEVTEFDYDDGTLLAIAIYTSDGLFNTIECYVPLTELDIKTIVTHEQFENASFEV